MGLQQHMRIKQQNELHAGKKRERVVAMLAAEFRKTWKYFTCCG